MKWSPIHTATLHKNTRTRKQGHACTHNFNPHHCMRRVIQQLLDTNEHRHTNENTYTQIHTFNPPSLHAKGHSAVSCHKRLQARKQGHAYNNNFNAHYVRGVIQQHHDIKEHKHANKDTYTQFQPPPLRMRGHSAAF